MLNPHDDDDDDDDSLNFTILHLVETPRPLLAPSRETNEWPNKCITDKMTQNSVPPFYLFGLDYLSQQTCKTATIKFPLKGEGLPN